MKRLALPPDPREVPWPFAAEPPNLVREITALTPVAVSKATAQPRFWAKLFREDTPENLTNKEAVICGLFVFFTPVVSTVDWHFKTHALFIIAPVIFYLEVTAFTLTCPIKRLFSNYPSPKSGVKIKSLNI